MFMQFSNIFCFIMSKIGMQNSIYCLYFIILHPFDAFLWMSSGGTTMYITITSSELTKAGLPVTRIEVAISAATNVD